MGGGWEPAPAALRYCIRVICYIGEAADDLATHRPKWLLLYMPTSAHVSFLFPKGRWLDFSVVSPCRLWFCLMCGFSF